MLYPILWRKCLVTQLCWILCDPMDSMDPMECHAPLSVGLSRPEYLSGLPCPPPEDLPNPGIEPTSCALWANSVLSEPPGKPDC